MIVIETHIETNIETRIDHINRFLVFNLLFLLHFQPCATKCLIPPLFKNMKGLSTAKLAMDGNTDPKELDLEWVEEL